MNQIRLLKSLFAALCIVLMAGAHADIDKPNNMMNWRTGLTSSAQPKKDYLAHLADQNIDLVINLAPPQSSGSLENEGGIVASKGVPYINIPVAWGSPTLHDFEYFSALMKASADRKVLVHCQEGFRASSFTFLYLVIHENMPSQSAVAKLTGVWVPNDTWMTFINQTLQHYGKTADIM